MVVSGPSIQGKANKLWFFIFYVFLDFCLALVIYLRGEYREYKESLLIIIYLG